MIRTKLRFDNYLMKSLKNHVIYYLIRAATEKSTFWNQQQGFQCSTWCLRYWIEFNNSGKLICFWNRSKPKYWVYIMSVNLIYLSIKCAISLNVFSQKQSLNKEHLINVIFSRQNVDFWGFSRILNCCTLIFITDCQSKFWERDRIYFTCTDKILYSKRFFSRENTFFEPLYALIP